MKIYNNGNGTRPTTRPDPSKIPQYLKALLTAVDQKNLAAALSAVKGLEVHNDNNQQRLLDAYYSIIDLGKELDRIEVTAQYSLKALELETNQDLRDRLINLVLVAAESFDVCTPEQQTIIRNCLAIFVEKNKLLDLTLSELPFWYSILSYVFKRGEQAEQKLALCDRVYQESSLLETRGQAAISCLYVATYLLEQGTLAVPLQQVRERAVFALSKSPKVIKEETAIAFDTLIVNLGRLGFIDLQQQALDIRRPAADDPIREYVRICALAAQDQETALAEIRQRSQSAPPSGTNKADYDFVETELRFINMTLQQAVVEKNTISVMSADVPPIGTPFRQDITGSPRGTQRELGRLMMAIREEGLRNLAPNAKKGNYVFLTPPIRRTSPDGQVSRVDSFLFYSPATSEVNQYIPAPLNPGKYIKIVYSLSPGGDGISPRANFAGVDREKQGEVPLIWEVIATVAFDIERLAGSSRNLFNRLEEQFIAEERKLQRENNRKSYEKLKSAFYDNPQYQRFQVELGNRTHLATKIIGRFPRGLQDGLYQLTATDFLNPLIESLQLTTNEGSKLANVALRSGERLFFHVDNNGRILFDNEAREGLPLLDDYLSELVLTAAIKLTYQHETKRSPGETTGYLVTPSESDNETTSSPSGVDDLEAIYRQEFYEQLRTQGLLGTIWCTREIVDRETIFRPLPDQSPKGKRSALEQLGATTLYIQTGASGVVQRLPVRRVRGGIAPYQHNPARELQQGLLDDRRPLPRYHGLYILTTFSDGSQHLKLYALREKAEQIDADGLIEKAEAELTGGTYRKADILLAGTKRPIRERISAALANGVTIVKQSVELYGPIETTFRRPPMTSLASLIQAGYVV